ncbi:Alpha/Beta hydrolase protein [Aspergillus bertholletiae]|uniref:Alpha/Beta hydrolase protein n=1 Tax=Aspergillus bertholletiae TaxID=1226010 RepID=A0A5N7BPG8_9EURO|nr:Alpha/Beta hydrolase protein [Aspergillus bertholletiae]
MIENVTYNTIQHPTIGRIKGISRIPGVSQFLGIQYATLSSRFSRGEMLESYSHEGVLDATEVGPNPLGPANGCEMEHRLIQHSLPFSEYRQSDTKCLTLNMAVPAHEDGNALPVLVFIHGGAFTAGSSSFPHYDFARITNLSLELEKPMIVVGVNYRLGVPGFLHSSSMEAAGCKPNNGLDDQRLALRWVKCHIAGFGGDPKQVTFIGESAGGASGCFHLHSDEPLFHQFISMSGTSLLRARKPALLENSFATITNIFGTGDLPPREQVQNLVDLPLDELRAKVGRHIPIGPMLDGDFISEVTTFKALVNDDNTKRLFPGIYSCKRILVGDCQMDATPLAARLANRTDVLSNTLINCLSTVLKDVDPNLTPRIANAYGLDSAAASNPDESKRRVLKFGNDICFAAPAQFFARAWSTSSIPGTAAFLYRFNCPNPWDGPWKSHATHVLDIAFALLNYTEYLSAGQRSAAERLAKDIITFVHGESPWEEYRYRTADGSMVYDAAAEGCDDLTKFVKKETPEEAGRRNFLQTIVPTELFDRLMDAWHMFMAFRGSNTKS